VIESFQPAVRLVGNCGRCASGIMFRFRCIDGERYLATLYVQAMLRKGWGAHRLDPSNMSSNARALRTNKIVVKLYDIWNQQKRYLLELMIGTSGCPA
jgi:hypothetical protein